MASTHDTIEGTQEATSSGRFPTTKRVSRPTLIGTDEAKTTPTNSASSLLSVDRTLLSTFGHARATTHRTTTQGLTTTYRHTSSAVTNCFVGTCLGVRYGNAHTATKGLAETSPKPRSLTHSIFSFISRHDCLTTSIGGTVL